MPLSYIFHLSDIHIRNGDNINSRYDEYKLVFDNTIISISNKILELNLSFDDFIIIISGDIFHNRMSVSNYGLLLFKDLINSLTKIGRLIIFQGNHEYQLNNNPSLISSLSFDINNLIVLNESRTFIIDDIGFSYLSINDTMDNTKLTGRINDLPFFPAINADVNYKIALFHGSFISAKLYNGDLIKDDIYTYPLELLKDFNYAILGDIHKRQIFHYKNNTLCGYSGSLIQQNFGEDILDHGYLLWDLKNRKVNEINVYNEKGYINMKEVNNEMLIRFNGKYENCLEKIINDNLDFFPKNIEIKTFSKINFHKLNSLLKTFNISFNIISRIDDKQDLFIDTNDKSIANNEINNIIDNDNILSYFNKLLSPDKYNKFIDIIKNKELLLFDINKYPDDLLNECLKKNKELSIIINSCINNNDIKQIKPTFSIRYLEWEGLLCYANKNWLNMNDLDTRTFMINGKNGIGKSAIYDILLLSIWGENTKNNIYSSSIINNNKKEGYTIIDIKLNDILYRIHRKYVLKDDKTKMQIKNSYLYQFINDTDIILLKKDKSCNDEIKLLFGNIDNFLSSSMLTQNIDNDILKMDAKKTLEIIDKSFNVEYIYNLYNLFKTAINKYRDFRKIIESKKNVYENLISKIDDDIDDNIIIIMKDELNNKTNKRDKLLNEYNSIILDISNPNNLNILEIDYISLLNTIDKNKIVEERIYNDYKKRYNELKYILKNEPDLLTYRDKYNNKLEIDLENKLVKIKPCEKTLLEQEENELKKYINDINDKKNSYNLDDLNRQLNILKIEKNKYEDEYKELINIKPLKINNPNLNKDDILRNIYLIYNSVDELNNYISASVKQNKENEIKLISINVSYNDYKKIINNKISIINEISKIKENIISLEKEFNNGFIKQQEFKLNNKPLIEIDNLLSTSQLISNELLKLDIDIDKITKEIELDELLINEISNLQNNLSKNIIELELFKSNDEYKFNPTCEYCCKRSWVCKIRDLENNINIDNEKIKNINKNNNYLLIKERYDNNKKNKERYNLLTEWFEYYKIKEIYDNQTKKLNLIINKKKIYNIQLLEKEKELNEIIELDNNFNNYSYYLYENFKSINDYDNYKKYNNNYNELTLQIDNLNKEINKIEELINYEINIKPRINKYTNLKDLYNEWLEYDYNIKIINTNEYYKLQEILELNDKYNEYIYNNNIKPLIKRKIELQEEIKLLENDILILNNKFIKIGTINDYNKENIYNYNNLLNNLNEIDNIIDILDIIIINFQSFRIEIYDKFILNNLLIKTNKIIKSLCHNETKPFKLNYIISIVKDIIHINWLIDNENVNENEKDKQIISISNASGYQHFVISLALRMSLFLNKQEIQCNQLYIDEGFINFDKYNLSIVPTFLKGLLTYFNNVIIVSHIDLIKDNIDEIAEINYNNNTSSMKYGNYKTSIIKKKK